MIPGLPESQRRQAAPRSKATSRRRRLLSQVADDRDRVSAAEGQEPSEEPETGPDGTEPGVTTLPSELAKLSVAENEEAAASTVPPAVAPAVAPAAPWIDLRAKISESVGADRVEFIEFLKHGHECSVLCDYSQPVADSEVSQALEVISQASETKSLKMTNGSLITSNFFILPREQPSNPIVRASSGTLYLMTLPSDTNSSWNVQSL